MENYPFDKKLSNEREVLNFFIEAIQYRNTHKIQSADIALHVFDATHPELKLSFPISAETDWLRFEFGALEAPGMPDDDDKDPDEYDDESWLRLLDLVEKAREKRTV